MLLILFISALFVSACTTNARNFKVQHGFSVENYGASDITDVIIRYGPVTQTFCKPVCHLPRPPARISGGGVWSAYMLVEDQMHITWKTDDGLVHVAVVPIRERIKDLSRLSVLSLQIDNDSLKILQYLRYLNPTILEYEKINIYP